MSISCPRHILQLACECLGSGEIIEIVGERMSTKDVLAIVKARGLEIVLQGGRPVLRGFEKKGMVTGPLLAVLKIHRERIVAELRARG